MWVFMTDGFISVVEDFKEPEYLWLRSRTKGQLEKLYPDYKPSYTPDNDYAYRIKVPRESVALFLAEAVREINYTNFKNAIQDNEYHSACSKVWTAFMSACRTGIYAVTSARRAGKSYAQQMFLDECEGKVVEVPEQKKKAKK